MLPDYDAGQCACLPDKVPVVLVQGNEGGKLVYHPRSQRGKIPGLHVLIEHADA
jgi:hypothetical protein